MYIFQNSWHVQHSASAESKTSNEYSRGKERCKHNLTLNSLALQSFCHASRVLALQSLPLYLRKAQREKSKIIPKQVEGHNVSKGTSEIADKISTEEINKWKRTSINWWVSIRQDEKKGENIQIPNASNARLLTLTTPILKEPQKLLWTLTRLSIFGWPAWNEVIPGKRQSSKTHARRDNRMKCIKEIKSGRSNYLTQERSGTHDLNGLFCKHLRKKWYQPFAMPYRK